MGKTEKVTMPPKPEKEAVKVGVSVYVTYLIFTIVIVAYSGFLYNEDAFRIHARNYIVLRPFEIFFDLVEKYSPFHQFIDDELVEHLKKPEENPAKTVAKEQDLPEILLTSEELKKYDGHSGSPGLYIALLGQIFDVSSGKAHYGPGGGYSFFSARDASRAFVSGDFSEAGLVDNVEGLSHQDYIGLDEWSKFYHKDYKYVGKLIGRFYDSEGQVTEDWKQLQGSISAAYHEADKSNAEKKIFPPCNSEWSAAKGQNVWCTTKSGGIDRNWIGVPRRLFNPGRQQERCACVKDSGASLYEPARQNDNRGDLDNPNLKEYPGCDPKAHRCQVKPPDQQ